MHSHWINASGDEGHSGLGDALFPFWSFTKSVIAVCALKLVEQGHLSLDDQLTDQPYTLRQLLRHSAGVPNYGGLAAYHAAVAAHDPAWSREKLLAAAFKEGMLFAPDKGWAYSNIGYMFAKELIERTTDQTLGEVISDMVTGPLGLASVTLAERQDQFAKVHWDAAAKYDPCWVYHGCLMGNASDAARLLHALFGGQLLGAELLNEMTQTKVLGGALDGRPWLQHGYALGLMSGVVENAGRALGHSGAGPFCVNAVYHFPDMDDPITVACFSDGMNEGVTELEAVRLAQNGN